MTGTRRRAWVVAIVLLAGGAIALPVAFAPRRPAPRGLRPISFVEGAKTRPLALAFDRHGERLFLADAQRVAALPVSELREGRARPTEVLAYADVGLSMIPREALLATEGRRLVLSGQGGDIVPAAIIDVGSRALVASITSTCREVALSRDGRLAVTHAWPGLGLCAWDLTEGTSCFGPRVNTGSYDVDPPALTLDVAPAANLVLHCWRGVTGVWNVATGETKVCPTRLFLARFVGDSRLVVGFERAESSRGPAKVTRWDPASGDLRVLPTRYMPGLVTRAWVSPDGEHLVANREGNLAVWSLTAPGEPRDYTFPGPPLVVIGEAIPALAFTPDGQALVVARANGELFWLDLDD